MVRTPHMRSSLVITFTCTELPRWLAMMLCSRPLEHVHLAYLRLCAHWLAAPHLPLPQALLTTIPLFEPMNLTISEQVTLGGFKEQSPTEGCLSLYGDYEVLWKGCWVFVLPVHRGHNKRRDVSMSIKDFLTQEVRDDPPASEHVERRSTISPGKS